MSKMIVVMCDIEDDVDLKEKRLAFRQEFLTEATADFQLWMELYAEMFGKPESKSEDIDPTKFIL